MNRKDKMILDRLSLTTREGGRVSANLRKVISYNLVCVMLAQGMAGATTPDVAEVKKSAPAIAMSLGWGGPPESGRAVARVPGWTFIEQQFAFTNEAEFQQLALSRDFIRKLERLAPRAMAPGCWIDKIPATKPPFVNIAPQLDDNSLYHNRMAVLNHWPAFQGRYPQTAQCLVKLGYRPSLSLLGIPGADFKEFVKRWETAFQERYDPGSCPAYPAYQAVGDCLLYVDFLAARGGRQDKWNACKLLVEPTMFIVLAFQKHSKSPEFGWAFGKELLWPMLAPTNEQFWMGGYPYLACLARNAMDKGKGEHLVHPDYIRVEKWIRSSVPMNSYEKASYAIFRSNSYGAIKDHIGSFLCLHAGHLDWRTDGLALTYMRNCLVRHFGKPQGEALFREYLGTIPIGKGPEIDEYRRSCANSIGKKIVEPIKPLHPLKGTK